MKTLKQHRAFEGTVKFLEHESTSTQTKMRLSVFEPDAPPIGMIIWLSGLTCTEENFITKGGALPHLSREKLILVCPDTSPRGLELPHEHTDWDFGSGASFYVDATTEYYRDHYRMETYIAEELYALLEQRYGLSQKTALMGHSMGGHGALTLGLNHPNKFKSLSAFSPIVNPMLCPWGMKAFKGYLGDDKAAWRRYDTTALLENGRRHPNTILVSQGTQDAFLKSELFTDRLDATCQNAGQGLELHWAEGYDHSYYFISTFIEHHIRQHSVILTT